MNVSTKPIFCLGLLRFCQELHRRWKSILHHILGVHHWEENGIEYKCYHKELTRDQQRMKKWLSVDSPAYKALVEIVMDKCLLKDLEQMMLFKHRYVYEKNCSGSVMAN